VRNVLGIAVGTSGLKAVLLDEDGRTIGEATAGYERRTPQPGWTEQDPDDWWAATRSALAELWAKGYSPNTLQQSA
jgi:xylulokinase